MRILMLAPECVAGPYGTPRCVTGRIHGLLALGHQVTLVTYPFGEDIRREGVRMVRAARLPGLRQIPVGPSLAKLAEDVPLLVAADRLLRRERFDLLHTHEEAAYLGVFLAWRHRLKHLYDMHCALPEALENYGWHMGPLRGLVRRLDAWVLNRVDGVLAICPALAERVREAAPRTPVVVVENVPFDMLTGSDDLPGGFDALPSRDLLYSGGFDRNQGVELLLRSLAADPAVPPVDIFGGRLPQVQEAWGLAQRLGLGARARFHGTVPFAEVWRASLGARALLSPRLHGSNVPSKIYHYLRAGRPIVATDLYGHRQVLDESCAELVAANPVDFAAGIRRVLENSAHAQRLARNARMRYEMRYTFASYLSGLREVLAVCGGAGWAPRPG